MIWPIGLIGGSWETGEELDGLPDIPKGTQRESLDLFLQLDLTVVEEADTTEHHCAQSDWEDENIELRPALILSECHQVMNRMFYEH